MDFWLSDEQQMLQETLRGFVEQRCPVTTLRAWYDEPSDFHLPIWTGLVEMGVAGLMVPEAHGGSGLGLLDAALVAEVLGEGAVPSPFLGHAVAVAAMLEAGSAAQRDDWLPRLADGSKTATIALAESGQRWDADAFETRFEGGRVNGTKLYVTGCDGADVFVVGLPAGRFAMVEKSAPGVSVEPLAPSDHTHRVARVRFDDAPGELLEGDGASRVRDAALVLLAADALGGAWRVVEMATAYAKQREQFGQPIGHFQAIKHQLADMAIEVEPGRALVWFAGHAFDERMDEAEEVAAVAKAHMTDRYVDVARSALEIYGGYGMTWECELHMWVKRALFDRSYLDGPVAHRARLARLRGWTSDDAGATP